MSQVISLRLSDETAERLKTSARRSGKSLNEMGALSIEEWLRQNEFADIEFRSFGGERQACLKGALPLWQLILVAQGLGMDPGKTAEHFGWPVHRVRAAFHYYEAYPEEIDQAITDNRAVDFEQLRRLLPQAERFDVSAVVAEQPAASPPGA